jgi:TolA-binding protein
MSNHLNKEIFTETGCLGRDKILQYKDGLLKRADMHDIEKHLVDCNLCSEALEGLSMVSGMAALDEIKEQFSNPSKKDGFNLKNYVAVAASVTGITLLTYFAINQVQDIKNNQSAYEFKASQKETLNEPANHTQDSSKSIESPAVLSTPNKSKTIILSETNTDDTAAPAFVTEDSPADPAQEESSANAVALKDESESNQGVTFTSAAENEEAVVDNGTSNRAELDKVIVTSKSSAKDESKKRKSSDQSIPSISEGESIERLTSKSESVTNSTYSLKMEDPISLYKKGNYTQAIIGFDKILVDFPNDENALFHKGMSLFNLKRYQEALNILEPISQNTSSSFIQIAEYHSALCFEELGKKDNALATYRKIVQRAGLYKDKAAKRIKAIE